MGKAISFLPGMTKAQWITVLLCHWGLASWMVIAAGQGIPSDDALFFIRGLSHFSVLEFSPHFPGYPGTILLGRLIGLFTETPMQAMALLSALSASAIPLAMLWIAHRAGGHAWLAYALGVLNPLWPGLGIALLSDAPGLLFFLIAIALAFPLDDGDESPWLRLLGCGAAMGMAFLCRPSYAPFIAALGVVVLIFPGPDVPLNRRGQARLAVLSAGLLVVVPVFTGVLLLEGWAYVSEGQRFLAGHTTLWGQTLWSEHLVPVSWWDTLTQPSGHNVSLPVLFVSACVVAVLGFTSPAATRWLLLSVPLLVAGVWTWTMQNPANPRHLAPCLALAMVLLSCAGPIMGDARMRAVLRRGIVMATLVLLLGRFFLHGMLAPPGAPPLMQAAQTVEDITKGQGHPALLITNHGVVSLRERLPTTRIVDAYYSADVASVMRGWSAGPILWLRSRPLGSSSEWETVASFAPRAWGEGGLWLYQRRSD